MIFSQYRYKNFHNDNKSKHPLSWNKMLSDNYNYCHKMNFLKWIELYFFIAIGRVKEYELPSFHRYWQLQIIKNDKTTLKVLIVKYEICKKDASQIRYLFNSTTELRDVEQKIIDYKNKIKNY